MKNIIKNALIVVLLILIYIKRPLVLASTIKGIELWKNSVFPSIFPILIISDLILSSNIINIISKFLGNAFEKIFKVSRYASYVFIMSVFSGCPSNAKYIKDLYDARVIDANECVKILAMSLLYNPLLILTITPFFTKKDTIFLLSTNIIINLIIGFINRNYHSSHNDQIKIKKNFDLVKSTNNAVNVLLLILGTIIIFITLSSIIPVDSPLLKGMLEITNGINMIGESNYLYKYKMLFTGILLSFGGFSIIGQIKSIFKDTSLDYSLFYKSRIIHLILFILAIIIYQW